VEISIRSINSEPPVRFLQRLAPAAGDRQSSSSRRTAVAPACGYESGTKRKVRLCRGISLTRLAYCQGGRLPYIYGRKV
jgi:hypothetical protein